MQTTYDISDKGAAIPEQFRGQSIPVDLPDPHETGEGADWQSILLPVLQSKRFGGPEASLEDAARSLVSAGVRTLRIVMRDTVVKALSKDGATIEDAAKALSTDFMPVPRKVDPNAEPKAKGSGEIRAAKATAARVNMATAKLVRAGDEKKLRQAIALEFVTAEAIEAERQRQAGLSAEDLAKLDAELAK